MKTEYREDVDVELWNALERAFWAYAVRMKDGSVTEKLEGEVKAFLDYIKDEEMCYEYEDEYGE